MNVYLIRHADALPLGTDGIASDEDRPLSDKGLTQVKWLGDAFRRLGVAFAKIGTSPLLRARQTAEGLARHLDLSDEHLGECAALAPGGAPKKLAKFLLKQDGEHIALVGHEPDLSRHAAWQIGDKKANLILAKAGVACIAFDGAPGKGLGTLLWLVTPAWLKGLPGARAEAASA